MTEDGETPADATATVESVVAFSLRSRNSPRETTSP
jgi:hypothetical protein